MRKLPKNTILLLAGVNLLALTSCTTEPDRFIYKVLVTNLSGNSVEMSLFSEGQLVDLLVMQSSESYECQYHAENFSGFRACLNSERTGIDSIRFVFDSNVGYVCTNKMSTNDLCFVDQRFLFADRVSGEFIDNGDNQFELVLSPNDFLNAFNLEE